MKNPKLFFPIPVLLLLLTVTSCSKDFVFYEGNWDTEKMSGDSISYIVIGDWGRLGGGSQKSVADQVDYLSKRFNAGFIISTGDNFYEKGVNSTSDIQWTASFENIYTKPGTHIPWYPVLGNHDYQSNPQAQVDYSLGSDRWKMPSRYHSFQKNINDTSTALFVFTDTSPFVGEYQGKQMADLQQQDTAAQLNWMKNLLQASKDEWKIVIGHHPVYSVGRHGNTHEMIVRFEPVFSSTGTDFYLAGHDHSLQHIYHPSHSTRYLVSGSGATQTRVDPNDYSLFAQSSPGLLVMTLYAQRANFYFFNQRGDLLHRMQVLK